MKFKQPRSGLEFSLQSPFLTTITIKTRAPTPPPKKGKEKRKHFRSLLLKLNSPTHRRKIGTSQIHIHDFWFCYSDFDFSVIRNPFQPFSQNFFKQSGVEFMTSDLTSPWISVGYLDNKHEHVPLVFRIMILTYDFHQTINTRVCVCVCVCVCLCVCVSVCVCFSVCVVIVFCPPPQGLCNDHAVQGISYKNVKTFLFPA